MAEAMLTTTDNPFNPFTQFEAWYAWDTRAGYNTLSYLGRIVKTSHDLSEADQAQAIDDAIDEIILYNITGNYKKVEKPEDVKE